MRTQLLFGVFCLGLLLQLSACRSCVDSLTEPKPYLVLVPPGQQGFIFYENISFSPDGKSILADRQLWDARPSEKPKKPYAILGDGYLYTSRFSPDGNFIFTIGPLQTALWRNEANLLSKPLVIFTDSNPVISDDLRSYIVYELHGDDDHITNRIMHIENDGEAKINFVLASSAYELFAFSPDGKYIAMIRESELLIWKNEVSADPKPISIVPFVFPEGSIFPFEFAFSPDGKTIVVHASTAVMLFRIDPNDKPRLMATLELYPSALNPIIFSSDNTTIAVKYRGKEYTSNGYKLIRFGRTGEMEIEDLPRVYRLEFSPDSKAILVGTAEETTLYRNEPKPLTRKIARFPDLFRERGWEKETPAFSPNNKYLAFESNGQLNVYKTEVSEYPKPFTIFWQRGEGSYLDFHGFSPDSKLILTTSRAPSVLLWKLPDEVGP